VNPNYKPTQLTRQPPQPQVVRPAMGPNQTREVVIGGVAFESSGRSLVRKDLPKPAPLPIKPTTTRPTQAEFSRAKAGHLMPSTRTYKPKTASRGRGHGRRLNRNMTLNNASRPYQARRTSSKRLKYSDKPCPRFTTTGACSRGLTCMYQHDPSKIAICWSFLLGKCPSTADTCNLSHDPTPERTPLCMHFANNGRCNRENCPYPHVHVGVRQGVCRDFAVLGYCEKGIKCDNQHVRECPDFAEKGACSIKGCKLPHVIRANRNRKSAASLPSTNGFSEQTASSAASISSAGTDNDSSLQHVSAENARLGDEYISLTFHESESSGEESDEEEEDEDDEDADSDEAQEIEPV